MLHTKNLSFAYSEQSFLFPDLSCKASETLLILGKSGKGKTTLLHLLAGLLKPKNGEIWIDNILVNQLKNNNLDKFRGKNIGIVFQKNYFIESLNVVENLQLAPYLSGQKTDKKKATELLESLGLGQKIYQKPYTLSQGEQQRLSLARALINQPRLILADEPTAALDDQNCEQVSHLLHQQAQKYQAALLVVTHDQRLKDRFSQQITL